MPRPTRGNIGRRTRHVNATALQRRSQTPDERAQANASQRERNARNRSVVPEIMRAAFNYNSQINYSMYGYIGIMVAICPHCDAAKFPGEMRGMCCANGKARLPPLETPPEPLYSLIFGASENSKHFLSHIQQYNSAFQMTSFGATNIIRDNFMPTFKIQGQIYHQACSLLPYPDADYQFLQIYFIGDENRELDQRCAIALNTRREIICELQRVFHQHIALVQLFEIALDRMPSDNH
ncbi:uncharacterized protein LOC128870196 [Anastrepha ludens]|uniref:uncharacterized protein LOC128870196 n=1 Tax=Anastrepha ludens TaxID=28586 RepID=UPI0023AECDB0|nr:uncharacterized protein LOC128870196 [Anastrepha ludens]